MTELVSNVLDLMRFESGRVPLRLDWQSLDDLVDAARQRLGDRLRQHKFELQCSVDVPHVYVDASLIVKVFANLFDNIAKYTPAGTKVVVSAAADPQLVRITVDDDGPGFPPGDPAHLFEKFQRGSGEGTVAGVGLGLAICRAIVRAHGGEIEAKRRPSGGSRIEFTLPASE
jgi:two-component system sensor histidine kinase KdpD